jgi:hypothetical protein
MNRFAHSSDESAGATSPGNVRRPPKHFTRDVLAVLAIVIVLVVGFLLAQTY